MPARPWADRLRDQLGFSTLGFSAALRFGLLAVLFLAGCSGGVGTDPFPEREVAPPPPKEIVSDDFHSGALNTELWEVVDPRGDGTVAFEGAGTSDARLLLSVPSGTTHAPWSTNTALRVMQAAADRDFEIEAKFESEPMEKFQGQGLLVEQDESNFIRFDVYSDATSFRVFSAKISNGSPLIMVNDAIASAATIHLRLRRTGDRWTAQYSYNGSNWVPAIAFSHPLEVFSVGVFASNDDPNPAYTAVVDYFFNTASRVIPEDTTRFCGDGLITPPETCEPPGTATCHDFCRNRPPSCGDGFINGTEECDDGNTANGDGCASDCSTEIVAVCGDGLVTVPETCEPPGTGTCNDLCTDRVPVCGDGYLTGTETCDDGNTIDGDGCASDCTTEIVAVCGDGVVSGLEQCDAPDVFACSTGQCFAPGSSEGPECSCVPPSSSSIIPPAGGVVSGFTSGASNYAGTCGAGSANAPEQVLEWTPAVSGTVTLETCSQNTEFDTVLHVRSGSLSGPEIACSDDETGCSVNSGSTNGVRHGSRVSFDVIAGQTYQVIVDGYEPSTGRSEGNFELTVISAGP